MAKRGVEQKTLIDQIKTDQVWRRLVNIRYGSKVIIADAEIDEVMAEMKKNEGQPEYQVAEIFLPVENQEKKAKPLPRLTNCSNNLGRILIFRLWPETSRKTLPQKMAEISAGTGLDSWAQIMTMPWSG